MSVSLHFLLLKDWLTLSRLGHWMRSNFSSYFSSVWKLNIDPHHTGQGWRHWRQSSPPVEEAEEEQYFLTNLVQELFPGWCKVQRLFSPHPMMLKLTNMKNCSKCNPHDAPIYKCKDVIKNVSFVNADCVCEHKETLIIAACLSFALCFCICGHQETLHKKMHRPDCLGFHLCFCCFGTFTVDGMSKSRN